VDTLLQKASVYDFGSWAEASDQDGRCTQTTFASASALVAQNADGSIDLIIRRSFSDYIMQWLLDAVKDTGFKSQA
ncbi:MAG: sarcosine oxidase, gamma subunit family protein, partial [Porticoccaceae bacterium]|nr:sarcosine oxidase, gamma subunit family protein [Porticoccaceae bacterium]